MAIIKPRWTTKHEFKVDLPQNNELEDHPEDALADIKKIPSLVSNQDKIEYSRKFNNELLENWERDELPSLQEKLEQAKKYHQE